jgi:hypothetical protein
MRVTQKTNPLQLYVLATHYLASILFSAARRRPISSLEDR